MNNNNMAHKLILLFVLLTLIKIEVSADVFDNKALAKTNSTFTSLVSSKQRSFNYEVEVIKVNRVQALKSFFQKYNSPLIENAETFIKVADQYGIDYKILPAISCIESGCGKHLIPSSYNPFGWGKGQILFNSFDESIEKVARGLDQIYLSRGLTTVEKIAPVYNPPSPTTWTQKVNYFINQISEFEKQN